MKEIENEFVKKVYVEKQSRKESADNLRKAIHDELFELSVEISKFKNQWKDEEEYYIKTLREGISKIQDELDVEKEIREEN